MVFRANPPGYGANTTLPKLSIDWKVRPAPHQSAPQTPHNPDLSIILPEGGRSNGVLVEIAVDFKLVLTVLSILIPGKAQLLQKVSSERVTPQISDWNWI